MVDASSAALAPSPRQSWLDVLLEDLSPQPGRFNATIRIVLTCVLVVAISMALEIPEMATSAYMVFFIQRKDAATTALTALMSVLALTFAIGLSILAYLITVEYAALRLPVMACMFFVGMFLSRTFAIGPLGFILGFVIMLTQAMVDLFPGPEMLVRGTLWIWIALAYPIAITAAVNLLLQPGQTSAPAVPKVRRLLVADAFTNPEYPRFALKVTFAAMFCYITYTGLDWPGIHTCVITCAIVALTTTAATMHKSALRIAGCLVGGGLALLAMVFVVPHLESITSLLLLVAVVGTPAAWISVGNERIAYFGLQMALAFFLCILQGYGPGTEITMVRDRVIGIVFGIVTMAVVFSHLWPDNGVRGLRQSLAAGMRLLHPPAQVITKSAQTTEQRD